MGRGAKLRMPSVARNMKYSQSMKEVHPQGISDSTARLVNALIVEVVERRVAVDWTTLKVTTRRIGQGTTWETIVSVEESEA